MVFLSFWLDRPSDIRVRNFKDANLGKLTMVALRIFKTFSVLFIFISRYRKIMHQKWCLHVSCIKLNCHMSLWAVSNSRKHYFIIQNDNVLLAKAFKILFSFFSHSQISPVHFSCLSCVRSASSPWQQSPQFPFQFCVLRLAFFCFSVLYCVISLACLAVPNFLFAH